MTTQRGGLGVVEAARRAVRRLFASDGRAACLVAAAYFMAGAAWIAVSDRLLARFVSDPHTLTVLQTYKGWAFVLASSLVIFAVVCGAFRLRSRVLGRRRRTDRFIGRLMDNLPGMAYRCRNDPQWTMEFVSDGVTELTGYQPRDLVRTREVSWEDLIDPVDRHRVREEVRRAIAQDRQFVLEYRIRDADGGQRWVWERGLPVHDEKGRLLWLEGFVSDVTPRKAAESRQEERLEQLRALRQIDLAITGSLDLGLSLRVALEQVTSRLGVDAADVLVLRPESSILERTAARGFRTDALRHTRLPLGKGPAGRAARDRAMVSIADLRQDPRAFEDAPQIVAEEFVSYRAVPLVAKGVVKGVLEVFHRTRLEPTREWLDFLETLAGQVAIAIDGATMFEDLQRAATDLRLAYDDTIEGWARALDLRDHDTEGHSRRVTELTVRLGRELGLREERLIHVRRGALLHDIGKVGIPDAILHKPGALTEEEWEVMRRHPVLAHEVLAPIEFLGPALAIPYCHHERWDGSGYPRRLRGEEIPLEARIFAVVDVWDALLSDRPYRDAWPPEKVRAYLRENAGVLFDPGVIQAFLGMEPDVLVRIAGNLARPKTESPPARRVVSG